MGISKKDWVGRLNDTAYIFYQGFRTSQAQACKYVGNQPVGTSTGEIASFQNDGVLTIPREQLWLYPEIDEVDRNASLGWLGQVKHWFQGIDVARPKDAKQLDYTPLYPQDETGSVHRYSILISKGSFGQASDKEAHQKKYATLVQHHQKINNIVLYGVSRGAATTFSALAEKKYEKVKLCVLEGPPASLSDLIRYYVSRFLGKFIYNQLIMSLAVGKHHKTGIEHQAMGHVEQFPNHVPLVIISSQQDMIVPQKSSIKLALAVASKRIKAEQNGESIAPVYFLQLDHSGHNHYGVLGSSQDPIRYQNFMHAVYKKHGLPYVHEFAAEGEKELKTAELTNSIFKNQVQLQERFKKEESARKAIRTEALERIQSKLKPLSPEEQQRVITMCSAMPLYHQHRNPYTWFGKTATQKQLESLLPSPSASTFII